MPELAYAGEPSTEKTLWLRLQIAVRRRHIATASLPHPPVEARDRLVQDHRPGPQLGGGQVGNCPKPTLLRHFWELRVAISDDCVWRDTDKFGFQGYRYDLTNWGKS